MGMLMSRVKSSFSFWALVLFISLLVLQWSPLPGIYLMFVGGALWCGLAVHAVLLGLFVEALLKRVPRFLIILPLAAYGGYYFMYIKQGREIDAKAQQMQTSNPSLVRQFDPAVNSLELPPDKAEFLASHYRVPVTYEVNTNFKPEGHISHRMLDAEQCAKARDVQAKLRARKVFVALNLVTPVRFDAGRFEGSFFKEDLVNDVCVLNFPETPPLQPVVVTQRGDYESWQRKRAIMEQFVDFSLDGQVFATFATASVWRLPPLPILLIGCYLNDAKPSWECFADFTRSYEVIDGTPKSVDKALFDTPVSIVLGLRKYARTDYTDFTGDTRWSALIERVEGYPEAQAKFKIEQNAELFAQFVDFVHDSGVETTGKGIFINLVHNGKTVPPAEMEAAILEKSEQLIPLRDAIAARWMQLLNAKIFVRNGWLRLLDKSLIVLPRDVYVTMPDQEVTQLLDALASNRGWDYFSSLYVRTADAGPRTLGFYEHALTKMQDQGRDVLPSALAICRIGEASEQARAILRKIFVESAKSPYASADDARINSTMFVTLLKLHDPLVADPYPTNFKRDDVISWYDAVRQGRGQTDMGPNNCEGWFQFPRRDLPSSLQPGLVYRDKAWIEAHAR
jgi:hypothetical protein